MRIKEALKEANRIRSKSDPRLTARALALLVFADSNATDRSKVSMLSQLSKNKTVELSKLKIVMNYTGTTVQFLLGYSEDPFN
jgi:hypothetical protein